MGGRYNVGLVGIDPPDSWAAVAHLPALRARPDRFAIAGIANSTQESGERAAKACGVDRVFANADALCTSDDVDIVVVTVKAALHAPIVERALAAGKHVYCEWPLGRDYAETRRLAALAETKQVLAVCGLQARSHPALRHLGELLAQGRIGKPLFATVVADGGNWGATIPQRFAYSTDAAQGATMLSVPIGHTLWGLTAILGDLVSVYADCRQRRQTMRLSDTGEDLALKTEDTIVAALAFGDGLPMSLHYRGGMNLTGGFQLQIIGETGQLVVRGEPFGAIEMIDLTISGAQSDSEALEEIPLPEHLKPQPSQGVVPDNVMAIYDLIHADLENGTTTAPTFADALENYRLIEAFRVSTEQGRRIDLAGFRPA